MKDYIDQFYNDGFATTFYLKPMKFFSRVIKNKKIYNVIDILIKILYTIVMIILAWYIFWDRYPL